MFFAPTSTQLDADAKADLRALVSKTGKKATRIVVVGFVQPSSATGNDRALSTARAKNVAAYLRSLGLKGDYTVRGDGTSAQDGATARRVTVAISYTK